MVVVGEVLSCCSGAVLVEVGASGVLLLLSETAILCALLGASVVLLRLWQLVSSVNVVKVKSVKKCSAVVGYRIHPCTLTHG